MIITSKTLGDALKCSIRPSFEARAVSIDSRSIHSGDLFFGIKGEHFDGNEFAAEALQMGAVAAVIDNCSFCSEKTVLVNNSLEALQMLGAHIKKTVAPKAVIGITGSVGKTTVKSWLNEMLCCFHRSFATRGNHNTIYGVPQDLSALEPGTEFCILELGSNNPGEISKLAKYVEPNIGVITNIYESHIGRFGNRAALAKEKISITDGLSAGSCIVYDGDSEHRSTIEAEAQRKDLRAISVGFADNCNFVITETDNGHIRLLGPSGVLEYKIEASGRHFAYASACAAATIHALGLDVARFVSHFNKLKPKPGRGEVLQCHKDGGSFELIDGSYNASLSSMLASLEVFATDSAHTRKIALLGQMMELGEYEMQYHIKLAEVLQTLDIDRVFFVGAKELWPIFLNLQNAECFDKLTDDVMKTVLDAIQDGSLVFVKGSRSIMLDKFVECCKAAP